MKYEDFKVGMGILYSAVSYTIIDLESTGRILCRNIVGPKYKLSIDKSRFGYVHKLFEPYVPVENRSRLFSVGSIVVNKMVKDEANDTVKNPSHYEGTYGVECIEAIANALTKEEFRGYCKGNMLKYIWREGTKNGDEDIAKVAKYTELLRRDYGRGFGK